MSESIRASLLLRPQWLEEYHAKSHRLTADRIGQLSLLSLCLNLPLFLLIDYRTWSTGQWALNLAHERVVWWRVAVILSSAAYYIAWRRSLLQKLGERIAIWAMMLATAVFGIWFSIAASTLIHDVSIFALSLFVIAAMLPLPSPAKVAIYPAALAVFMVAIWLMYPQPTLFMDIVANAISCAIVAVIVDRMVLNAHLTNFTKGKVIEEERGKSDRLLRNVLPDEVADKLRDAPAEPIVEFHEEVSVVFADVVGFTQLSMKLSAGDLIRILDKLFLAFDEVAGRLSIEKIKTIGDAYMAACGVPVAVPDHSERSADLAIEMLAIVQRLNLDPGFPLSLRIGMHSGPVIAGVIGRKKFCYDLWGDTVNIASRLESHGIPSRIHVSEQVYHRLKARFILEPRGEVALRGRGTMNTYFLVGRRQVLD